MAETWTSPAPAGPEPAPLRGPEALTRSIRGLEEAAALDGPADVLAGAADRLLGAPALDRALRGAWLGHALHPLLTDFPLGAWIGAAVLDLAGGPGARPAARRLVGFGLAASIPTALSGVAEWRGTGAPARRVGLVHAGLNVSALGFYAASFRARCRGSHGAGVALGLIGGAVATLGGHLGGHLSIGRKVGTTDPAFVSGGAGGT
jgi:hypothetical protein